MISAEYHSQLINFRVANAPRVGFLDWAGRQRRCYIVHDGYVRGYSYIADICKREAGEVSDPWNLVDWPEGTYIVRYPEWHPVKEVPYKGFQGWRYYTYPTSIPTHK